MNLLSANKINITKAAEIIRSGGIVAFPTETVYGLGADALNPIAASRIFEAKKRPFFDPLIVHIDAIDFIEKITTGFGKIEFKLAERFWPGPLTLVLPKSNIVPDIVTAGLPTVAVRMPDNKTARELIRSSNTPIAAPSANLFGSISPTNAKHVIDQLGSRVDMILDGGPCSIGIESTIVSIENGKATLLRHGGISAEEIEEICSLNIAEPEHNNTADSENRPSAPGQLASHYSPDTPLVIVPDISDININSDSRAGLLVFSSHKEAKGFETIEILSESGNMREAAANLFSCLHKLDDRKLDIIYAETIPEYGLGRAIMDRLSRAAVKK